VATREWGEQISGEIKGPISGTPTISGIYLQNIAEPELLNGD